MMQTTRAIFERLRRGLEEVVAQYHFQNDGVTNALALVEQILQAAWIDTYSPNLSTYCIKICRELYRAYAAGTHAPLNNLFLLVPLPSDSRQQICSWIEALKEQDLQCVSTGLFNNTLTIADILSLYQHTPMSDDSTANIVNTIFGLAHRIQLEFNEPLVQQRREWGEKRRKLQKSLNNCVTRMEHIVSDITTKSLPPSTTETSASIQNSLLSFRNEFDKVSPLLKIIHKNSFDYDLASEDGQINFHISSIKNTLSKVFLSSWIRDCTPSSPKLAKACDRICKHLYMIFRAHSESKCRDSTFHSLFVLIPQTTNVCDRLKARLTKFIVVLEKNKLAPQWNPEQNIALTTDKVKAIRDSLTPETIHSLELMSSVNLFLYDHCVRHIIKSKAYSIQGIAYHATILSTLSGSEIRLTKENTDSILYRVKETIKIMNGFCKDVENF